MAAVRSSSPATRQPSNERWRLQDHAAPKRAMMLPVSAPFHCKLMQPAADVMARALADVVVKRRLRPVIATVLAAPLTEPVEILRRLVEQITDTVRCASWSPSWPRTEPRHSMKLGSGKVLSGLIKRIADGVDTLAVGTPQDLEAFKLAFVAARKF